jgi:hypothetical protein
MERTAAEASNLILILRGDTLVLSADMPILQSALVGPSTALSCMSIMPTVGHSQQKSNTNCPN